MQEFDKELFQEKRRLPYAGIAQKGLVFTGLLLAIIVATNNPAIGGPKVILLFLVVLFALLVNLFALLLQYLALIIKLNDYSSTQLIYCSVTLAFGVVTLVGLQTLGQLRIVDVLLVGMFVTVLQFYIIRRF